MDKNIEIRGGIKMPRVGLGTWKLENDVNVEACVEEAILAGYRAIDTAAAYKNEEGVGRGLRRALEKTGLKREDIFITSKVWNDRLTKGDVLEAFEESLAKLEVDYLDLYLVHWPVEGKFTAAWHQLEKLLQEGRVRAIGVCNFQIHHMETLLANSKEIPALNQIERHPYMVQEELKDYCESKGIIIEAWAPLMQDGFKGDKLLTEIGKNYGKTAAQVGLRWGLETNTIIIPKSSNITRIKENFDIWDFSLTKEEVAAITKLNEDKRVGPDPDNFSF